jgi:hypothetical protein
MTIFYDINILDQHRGPIYHACTLKAICCSMAWGLRYSKVNHIFFPYILQKLHVAQSPLASLMVGLVTKINIHDIQLICSAFYGFCWPLLDQARELSLWVGPHHYCWGNGGLVKLDPCVFVVNLSQVDPSTGIWGSLHGQIV